MVEIRRKAISSLKAGEELEVVSNVYIYRRNFDVPYSLRIYVGIEGVEESIGSLEGVFVSSIKLEDKVKDGESHIDFPDDQRKEFEERYDGKFFLFKS